MQVRLPKAVRVSPSHCPDPDEWTYPGCVSSGQQFAPVVTNGAPQRPSGDDVVQAERFDARPRGRRMLAPLATALAIAAVTGYVAAVDPNESGHYPLCPTRWLLHVDCPGCGLMRGTYALCHGDLSGALDHNILLAAFVPFALVLWIRWLVRAWRGVTPALTARQARTRTRWTIVVLVAVIVFGVVRNFVPYLGSGIG